MRIAFDARRSGLSNNGGSRTIILSARALSINGNDSYVVSKTNHFSWFPVGEVRSDFVPETDVIVAVHGNLDVIPTLNHEIGKKAWYIRLHEAPIDNYKIPNIKKIVNSLGLLNEIKQLGVNVESFSVVPQGIDIDNWTDFDNRGKKITIGSLYNPKPRKNWGEFKQLSKLLGDRFNYVAFGDYECVDDFLSKYIRRPSLKELVALYNECHVWFSPTMKEGLHNVPMEAALCGCLVMCGNYINNGMIMDYAFDGKTAHVYNDVKDCVNIFNSLDFSLVNNMKDHIRSYVGNRSEAMNKFVRALEC